MDSQGSGAVGPGDAMLPGATRAVYRQLFRKSPFRRLVVATFTTGLGDWIGFFAIIALTEHILGPTRAAAFAVSGVMVARVVPNLLIGPVSGVFVDRWDRKRVLIATNLGRGAVMALIPLTDEVLTLLLATLVIEILSSLFGPAKDAVLPTLVRPDHLVAANQVNLITTYGTLPFGGVLYAGLVALAAKVAPAGSFLADRPIALPIWFNALCFWISVPLLAGLTFTRSTARRGSDPATAPGPWEQLKEGFRFIGRHPVIRALVAGVMVAFAAAGVVIVTGAFFASLLNTGPSGHGILVAVVGVGLVGGLVASAPLSRRLDVELLFAPGVAVAGGALIVTAMMPTLTAVILPAVIMGFGAGVAFIVGYTVLQKRADDRIRGRTFAAFNAGVRLAIFGSTIAVPLLIGVLGRETRRLTELPDGGQAFLYPYTFGGVRITMIAGGVLAVGGALLAGRVLHRAFDAERKALELPSQPALPVTSLGLLVAFEGGDGVGKSTQIRLLRSAIERAGHDALVTREPGGTDIGEAIRQLLLSPSSEVMSDRTEALLYAAARAQHVEEVIRPALEKGAVVLCDRFVDSSVVYQGAGRRLGESQVEALNRWATDELQADLVVLLDLDPVDGLRRAGAAGDHDRLEAAGIGFHRVVRGAYRRRAEADSARYLVLDARRSVEDLHAEIRDKVLDCLERAERGRTAGADQRHGASEEDSDLHEGGLS